MLVGIEDQRIDEMYVDLLNRALHEKFTKIPPNERILLLPQCLRGDKCPAEQDQEGFHCKQCGKCKIAEIMKIAKKLKTKVFVLPGGSMVPRLLKKYKPKAVIGVACYRELEQGMGLVEKQGLPTQGVCLLRDGCKNTDVDLLELKELMQNNGH